MQNALKMIHALILMLIAFMGLAETGGADGASKKAEVIQHFDEALEAEHIKLPAMLEAGLNTILPGLIDLVVAWTKTNPFIQGVFGKVMGVVMLVATGLALAENPADPAAQAQLVPELKTAVTGFGVLLPGWVGGALDFAGPAIVALIVKLTGGKADPLASSAPASAHS